MSTISTKWSSKNCMDDKNDDIVEEIKQITMDN